MFHKIKSVAPMPNFLLLLHFSDGSAKQYDMNPLISSMDAFTSLKTVPGLFEQVSVDSGGYGVSWNDNIDLDCEELWANGADVSTPFQGLMSFSDASALWGLNESTLRKAVCYGKLVDGLDSMKFGKQWVVTRDAMLREYGQPK